MRSIMRTSRSVHPTSYILFSFFYEYLVLRHNYSILPWRSDKEGMPEVRGPLT
uniref:Uncharacterized protein n=1 Tax=Arion vulgaris TaxID=1028688 RepID=A0A0B7BA79_9EUPU